MTDYGSGGVLGVAASLPATAGVGLFMMDRATPALIYGFIIVMAASLLLNIAMITRYLINKRRTDGK